MSNIDTAELQLDVQDDDVMDEEQQAPEPEQTSSSTPVAPSSSPTPARRTSKRQRTSLFSVSSFRTSKGDKNYDIDDIDLD